MEKTANNTRLFEPDEGAARQTLFSRRDFAKLALSLLGTAGAGCKAPQRAPAAVQTDEEFFKEQARRIADSALLKAGQTVGKYRNQTPYDIHVPGGNMGYPAYWPRDSVMMLGGDFISAKEVEDWIRLMCSTIRSPEPWQVRPGVTVPAYAVPDHINFDGKATYWQGNYETGDKQGGFPLGNTPLLDDNFWFVTAVYEHWKLAGDLRLFHSSVRTFSREEKLVDVCEKVYRMPATDLATGLVFAYGKPGETARDWGFCDGIPKSGKYLFTSVLKFLAAKQLAEIFEAAGDTAKAERYRSDAARIKKSLAPTFFHASPGGSEGWLHSTTGVGNQPDVWGSAFALFNDVVDEDTAQKVSRALVHAFRERTAVREGCVRQILTTDQVNHGGWEGVEGPAIAGQNGGYWGTATGWYIVAMQKSDPAAASTMTKEFIQFLRTDMRADGMAEAWEWFNPDTGGRNNPLYVATVALPYLCLKKAGLLAAR
jgi:hypothetical protein